jgi:hypothetical protein
MDEEKLSDDPIDEPMGRAKSFFGTLTIAVVAGVTLLVVLYGMQQVFLLIASYGD